jgi:predicted flap endonuclease-1-like 5' DNA nuclease
MQDDYFPRAALIITGTAGDLVGGIAQVTIVESFKGPPAGESAQVMSAAGECSYEIAPPGSEQFIMALTTNPDGLPVTNRCTAFPAESIEAQQVSAAARAASAAAATPAPTTEATAAPTGDAPTSAPEPSPTSPAGVTPPAAEDDDSGSSGWLIVGVVAVGAAVLAAGVAGIAYYRRR